MSIYVSTPGSSSCQYSFGVYNSAGTLVMNSGVMTNSTTVSCSSGGPKVLTASTSPAATLATITPGFYYVVTTGNETTGQLYAAPMNAGISSMLNSLAAEQIGYAASASTNGVLPSTLPSLLAGTMYLPLVALVK